MTNDNRLRGVVIRAFSSTILGNRVKGDPIKADRDYMRHLVGNGLAECDELGGDEVIEEEPREAKVIPNDKPKRRRRRKK